MKILSKVASNWNSQHNFSTSQALPTATKTQQISLAIKIIESHENIYETLSWLHRVATYHGRHWVLTVIISQRCYNECHYVLPPFSSRNVWPLFYQPTIFRIGNAGECFVKSWQETSIVAITICHSMARELIVDSCRYPFSLIQFVWIYIKPL